MHANLRINKNRYNLSNLEVDFRQYLLAVNKLRPVTVKNYISDYRLFSNWLNKNSEEYGIEKTNSPADLFEQITPNILFDYRDYLQSSRFPRRSVNRRLSTLRKLFAFAVDQGWINKNPSKRLRNVGKKSGRKQVDKFAYLSAFMSDIKNDGLSGDQAQAVVDDINEFFTIISS